MLTYGETMTRYVTVQHTMYHAGLHVITRYIAVVARLPVIVRHYGDIVAESNHELCAVTAHTSLCFSTSKIQQCVDIPIME